MKRLKGTEQQARVYKGYGIVRDKNGKPRVDNPATLTPMHIAQLTPLEKRELGVWDGEFAVGASGWTKLRQLRPNEFYVEENASAVNQIVVGTRILKISPRLDLKQGEHLHVDMTNPQRN